MKGNAKMYKPELFFSDWTKKSGIFIGEKIKIVRKFQSSNWSKKAEILVGQNKWKNNPGFVPMCAALGYNHTNVQLSPFQLENQKQAAMEIYTYYPLIQS